MSRAKSGEMAGFNRRALFAFGGLALAGIGLAARAVHLQLLDHEFLVSKGEARFTREVEMKATRGSIFDRNGAPLAISTPMESVWVNPQELAPVPERWPKLAAALKRKSGELTQVISRNQERSHLWLARHLSPEEAQRVRQLQIPGVYFEREYHRYFPEGEVAGHVLGFTDVDDQGIEGLESVYDHWLAGEKGYKRVIRDRRGRRVQDIEQIRPKTAGRDLTLSLDMRLQYLAYRELKAAIQENRARAGSMVVIDVTTGEVLAMVNQPTFNPNDRAQVVKGNKNGLNRNRAVTDILEPGSSFKPFVVAAALESGRFNAASIIDTSPMTVGGKYLEDEHQIGPASLAQVLAKSSNVGMTKIALALERDQLWETMRHLGFGQVTASGFPGESAGVLSNVSNWRDYTISSISRGYNISATPLQLAQAYAIIGALGVARPVSMLKADAAPEGERVISERTARTLITLLESVINDGTGTRAAIPGYRVAGKTGTARKNEGGGYYDDRFTAVFGGLAPASNPRFAAVVVIDDPAAGRYYGGEIAAPVFSRVIGGALRLKGVAPDATSGVSGDPLTGVATMVTR